jgi:PKD repeat protein
MLAIVAAGCSAADSLIVPGLEPPVTLTATPLNMTGIRLDWTPGNTADLDRYRLERRTNFRGKFEFLVEALPGDLVYFDTGLQPETSYGYRIVAVNREGQRSESSTIAGAQTAPLSSLKVETNLGGGTDPRVADPNGYRVLVQGARDTTFEIGTIDGTTITPLPPGEYTITLDDVLPTCTVTNGLTRQVTVVDTGLVTRAGVSFTAACADPSKGRIVAQVSVAGDSVDPDGYLVRYAGIITGDTLPAIGETRVSGSGGLAAFADLRPGDYQFSLDDVELPCLVNGPGTADVQVHPLSADTVQFAVTCPNKGGGNPGAPLVLRQHWNPQTAAKGQTVDLEVAVDLSGLAGKSVGVLQANVRFDQAVLTFQSASAPVGSLFGPPTVNSSTPGKLTWLSVSAVASQPGGVLPVATFRFAVAGAGGNTTATRTQIELVFDLSGTEDLATLFRVVEDTFTVGTGGGGGNQQPTAQAGGPYSGTAGSAISFSSAGSSDPDGSIASYNWVFGDGATSTQANPTHSYAVAGSFTATLTVTDNQGATASDQAAVTVAGAGGGNQAPVANAGGPYSGTAGAAISFSSAGSSDPDGSIATYSWDFGDGGNSTQQNPTHSYAAAGGYTATLTVTDNLGATGSAQGAVTVTGGSTTPLAWTSSFGGFEQVLGTYPLIITLNLTSDIPETTGPEALGSYSVDSLVWDPAVLEYHSLAFGSGGGSFNTTNATGGCKCKLVFNGSPTTNTGVVTVATVRFRPVGSPGASTTTRTSLGPVLSTPALGSFNYRSRIQLVEGSLTLP